MNRFAKKLLTIVISIAALLYIALQIQLNLGDMIETDMAIFSQTKDTIQVQGYIFRDETPVTAMSDGTISYFFKEGEKVAAKTTVAAIYENIGDAGIQNQINALNSKINILEKSFAAEYYAKDKGSIAQLDELIKQQIASLTAAVRDNDLRIAALGQDNLLIDLNRRRSLVQTINLFEYQLSLYNTQKSVLETSLSGKSTPVRVNAPGYFYSTVDGYERIFTTELLFSLTIEQFHALEGKTADNTLISNSAGKLVNSPKWYLVIELDNKIVNGLKDNYKSGKYSIIFPYSGSITLEMTLVNNISQTNFETSVLVFSSDYMPEGFNYSRSQPVRIVREEYNGLKIPMSSLRVRDGVTGVYSLKGTVVVFKEATVLYEQNGYYICKLIDEYDIAKVSSVKLSLYDTVVISGKNLYPGKIVS